MILVVEMRELRSSKESFKNKKKVIKKVKGFDPHPCVAQKLTILTLAISNQNKKVSLHR